MTPDCEGSKTGSDGGVVAKEVAPDDLDLFTDRVNIHRGQSARKKTPEQAISRIEQLSPKSHHH